MSRAELTRRLGDLRRRMPRHLLPVFSILLLLLLGCAYAEGDVPVNSVTLFSAGKTKVPEKMGDEDPTRDVNFFASPLLVGGNGVMVAIAEAQYTKDNRNATDVVARYIETEGENWAVNPTENNGTNWRTQLVLQGKEEGPHHSVLRSPTAVVKDDKICLLALHNKGSGDSVVLDRWHFELTVGVIRGEVGNKTIEWHAFESLSSNLTEEAKNKHLKVFPGSDNSALLRSNGTIVFSANATNKEGKWGHAIMQLGTDEEQWEVSFVEKPNECLDFYLFEWKEKLIVTISGCSDRKVYLKEYDEVSKEWNIFSGKMPRPLEIRYGLNDLIFATIGNKNVLLFTEERITYMGMDWREQIGLWVTDGNRMYGVGEIADAFRLTFGGLLYTNGELFLVYQDTGNGLGKIVVKRLKGELEKIEFVSKTWAESDAYLSKPCGETAPKGASPDTPCVTPVPTDGLVGFLSNNSGSSYWQDEYNFVNATLRGGVKVSNGFVFHGTGDGVYWPVGNLNFVELYNFMRYGLTVLATITLHEIPDNDTPLLAVDRVGSNERLGLWYKDEQWKVVYRGGVESLAIGFETQKEYRVAIVVKNKTISVYVNGWFQGRSLPIATHRDKSLSVGSIYIGGYDYVSRINMTVTNVLLYSRALSDTEVEAASRTIETGTPTVPKETFEKVPEFEETPERPTNPKETPDTPATPNETPDTPATPNETHDTPATPNETHDTPAKPSKTPDMPATPSETHDTPATPSETPKAPTDRKEDSSEHMRMGVSLLFLLGLRALAVFFPASI